MAQILVGLIGDAEDANVQALMNSILKAASGKDVRITPIVGESVTAEPPSTSAPQTEDTSAPTAEKTATKPPKDFDVFHASGEKRAGYTKPEDAALVMLHALHEITDLTQIAAFAKANMKTIARFPKKLSKETQDAVVAYTKGIQDAAKVAELDPTANAGPTVSEGTDAAVLAAFGATTAEAGANSAATPGPTATTVASPSEGPTTASSGAASSDTPAPGAATPDASSSGDATSDEAALAAAFGGFAPAAPTAAPAITRQDYVREMALLGGQMGPISGAAWLKSLGYTGVFDVPEDKWAATIASGVAHVKMLKA